jgi:radical SAM superfamily enzyme YgiQ (UPF0313 family)
MCWTNSVPYLVGFSLTSVPFNELRGGDAQGKGTLRRAVSGAVGPVPGAGKGHPGADMVCVGEGEEAIVELANALDAGQDYSGSRICGYDGTVRSFATQVAPSPTLEKNRHPRLRRVAYLPLSRRPLRRDVYPPNSGASNCIMTQRGCPYSCSFCIESVYQEQYGNSVRRRSVDVVIQETGRGETQARHHGRWSSMTTSSPHIPKWLREFAPRYKAEVGLPFWCYTYPRTTARKRS